MIGKWWEVKSSNKQLKGVNGMEEKINQFLEFRKQFTASQWHEINNIIDSQFRKKAAELQLDDQDVEVIKNIIVQQKIMH